MSDAIYDQTLAFAGICQAVSIVEQLAVDGHCDQQAFDCCLNTITNNNPHSTLDVFGAETNLKVGFAQFIHLMHNPTEHDMARYIMNLMVLEQKLMRNSQALAALSSRIERLKHQQSLNEHSSTADTSSYIANIASIYLDIISPIGPRIQVVGDPTTLQDPAIQNKIRTALLAGIRSTVLWRQLGGKRRHFIFRRRAIIEQIQSLLSKS